MLTFKNPGGRIDYTNTTGTAIASGQVVALINTTTGFIGIAVTAIPASGGVGELCIGYPEKVHTLAKKVGDVFTPGQIVYYDLTNLYLTTTSSSNVRAGYSDGAYASAATTAGVIINY